MMSNGYPSSIQDGNNLSVSMIAETNLQHQPRKEGLTTKIRQTLNAAGKRVQGTRQRELSVPNLTTLTPQSRELILRTVEAIKHEDSKNIVRTLDESRDLLKRSFEEFKLEQNECRKRLEQITSKKEAAMQRRKENAIPLSIFMRQKRDIESLADLHPNPGMNTTYQAYFQTLLTSDKNSQQHPSDKAAVIKYIRGRERRKRAEENRKNFQLTDDILEKQTADLMQKIDGMDMRLEQERQRQQEILRTKMHEKKNKSKTITEANEIIDQAHEANLARQRVEQTHKGKIEARLLSARRRAPAHMIHIQSRLTNENDSSQLTDEQRTVTKNSILLLNENDGNKAVLSTTPICGDEDSNKKIVNIDI